MILPDLNGQKIVDMSSRFQMEQRIIAVPAAETGEGFIGLYMIISRHPLVADHSIFYWPLCLGEDEAAPSAQRVADMAAQNRNILGDDLVVIDTGERFSSFSSAADRVVALKAGLERANCVQPATLSAKENRT